MASCTMPVSEGTGVETHSASIGKSRKTILELFMSNCVRNVMDLANLQMLLGNMGKPGGGVNPLRRQNNVQGACDMGGL